MISTCHGPLRQPMVPKARPMSQTASAQPASSRSVVSGRALVVKSRSFCWRPIIASRTGPADQGQLLAGVGEAGAELVDDGTDPVELCPDAALDLDDRERRQGGVGHDGPVYVPGWLGPATRVGLCLARPRSVLP